MLNDSFIIEDYKITNVSLCCTYLLLSVIKSYPKLYHMDLIVARYLLIIYNSFPCRMIGSEIGT